MTDNRPAPKNKETVRNILYSFLIYCGMFYIFIAILDSSVLTKPSFTPQVNGKDVVAVLLSVVVAVIFYRWLKKRSDREK